VTSYIWSSQFTFVEGKHIQSGKYALLSLNISLDV